MKKVVFTLFVLLISANVCLSSTEAPPFLVVEKEGDIFLKTNSKEVRLTYTGLNMSPIIHPSGEWIYYIKTTEAIMDNGDVGSVYTPEGYSGSYIFKEEIWKMTMSGEKKSFVYKSPEAPKPNQTWYTLSSINNIQFSPDGERIYFETNKSYISNAIHIMESDGSKAKMLGAGNNLKIIESNSYSKDQYIGYLVTHQHRYFQFGGSYDWYWLFDPDFKEIGPIGDNIPDGINFIDQTIWKPTSDKDI